MGTEERILDITLGIRGGMLLLRFTAGPFLLYYLFLNTFHVEHIYRPL
jgi:hypothetical protein